MRLSTQAATLSLIFLFGAAPATKPATTKPARSAVGSSLADRLARQKAEATVSAAIRNLLHEYSTGKLRTSSDWFTEHSSPDLTHEAVFKGLEQPMTDDPAAAAYVKWQLLSGLRAKIDSAMVSRACEIYRNAPQPIAQAGESQDEKSKLELARRNARKEDIPKLNQDIAETQQRRERQNGPILSYRNELFAKLPEQNYDVLKAGLQDAYTRLQAGADTQSIMDPLLKQTREWMVSSDATSQQLNDLAKLTATLSKEKSPEFYSHAEWSERSYRVNWYKKRYDLNKYGQLDKLSKDLSETARNGPAATGGLKYKDEKKKKD
jgi:hypothetical protein